jgi:fructokinase
MNPIVGIGEVLWDVYPDGRKVAGGAPFNFAFHCHQLGHPAAIVSRVGSDDLGRELRARVRELGLSDEYIQTDHEYATGTVQVKLDAHAVPTYTITENVAWDHLELTPKLSELAARTAAVCFGSLALRSKLSSVAIIQTAENVRRSNGLVVCDLNVRLPFVDCETLSTRCLSQRWSWVKASSEDLAILVNRCPDGPWYDYGEWPVRVVTHGENGCEIIDTEGRVVREPGVPAKVVDTVGAGDAFTAALVCLHLEGKPMPECARFAVHYAARVCEHPGGTPRIDRAEVERAAGFAP